MLDAFGPGILYVTRTDVANSTPINIGYAQEFSLDISASVKELFGQNQYPLDVARGTAKVGGKAKAAVLSGVAWNNAFFGDTFATGGILWAPAESGTVPASTTYTVTVSHSATFDADLGVLYAGSGLPMTKVASSPASGQYSVSAGVYTFSVSDASTAVSISYTYTTTAGQYLAVNQHTIGYSPLFQLDYYTSRNSKQFIVRLYQCMANKISLASKLEDFIMPELDFNVFANSSGNVGRLYFPEVS